MEKTSAFGPTRRLPEILLLLMQLKFSFQKVMKAGQPRHSYVLRHIALRLMSSSPVLIFLGSCSL